MTTSIEPRTGTELRLTAAEARQVSELTLRLAGQYRAADDERLLQDLPLLTGELPVRVRRFLRAFSLDQARGFCAVNGHLVDDERIGPTPAHWKDETRIHHELPEEILVLLYGSLLGEPFGWATQQDGHLVNDVFPIRQYEHELLGTGSKTPLTLHTEDAFHPYRADYIILSALRNPDTVPVTVAEADFSELPQDVLDVLFQSRFHIVPDKSHLPENNTVRTDEDRLVFENIARLIDGLGPVPVLTGSRAHPLLCFDATHMSAPEDDPEAVRALAAAAKLLDAGLTDCPLEAGSCVFMNNHRVVHSRSAFEARYDGTDRWLKRVNVTHDLRKSRAMRRSVGSRLIG
ncbi:arginine beta-hydroxylase, Fe(II)/alpha-ketoglutarate-dependent [Streptomyces sp. ISL-44]|uniref:arginine beta-hydroxylase, Fe(II)/alpha-ketoglutarate-dependent n=1 Tax=Streptomyces sp. ISL-44 TaxID=2819184 RepID=UPI001BEB4CD5|nr:arginine beta-hydroxylase, Fe(II)/alpha-ketoglutarate-dependent [Streptomyces sp. ISL-44]MBT2542715.1 arginine beta-hydroxylase, Fe(II)/alpha-ketoglutarate-dependent [Streptomyces sp. ISL-44]